MFDREIAKTTEGGQTMAEYAVVLGVITIAIVTTFAALSGAILAAFERTLVSPRTRFDAWVDGDDAALTEAEARGLLLFQGRAGCASCHQGWAFTDHAFYDIGLPDASDRGRGAVLDALLGAERLYRTAPGRARWEAAARRNLAAERAALSA